MQSGWTEKDGKEKTLVVILENKNEGKIIIEALEQYCKNNPRKKSAKKLLKEFVQNLSVY